MKSIKDISWNVDEPTYRANEALSFSTISKFYREGFQNIDKLFEKEESQSLTFGSIVDCLLTEGQDEFNKKYFVCVVPLVSDEYKLVLKDIKNELGDTYKSLYDIPDKTIVQYLDKYGVYQNKWYDNTKANKVREGGDAYYQIMFKSEGKQVIPKDMYDDAVSCILTFKESRATEFYFREDNPFDGIERKYQLKFQGEYDYNGHKIPLRCMDDLIVVDHKNKTIQICDVKTSSEEEYLFSRHFMKWQYWMQAEIYTYILKQNILKDDYFKDFKILPFKFLVINRNNRTPLVWEWPLSDCEKDIVIEGKTRNIYIPSWIGYAEDLDMYLSLKPKTPKGISEFHENNILSALKEW